MNPVRRYTQYEIQYIKDNPKKSDRVLGIDLGRAKSSIAQKRKRLKITKRLTKEQREAIANSKPYFKILAKQYNVSVRTIYRIITSSYKRKAA